MKVSFSLLVAEHYVPQQHHLLGTKRFRASVLRPRDE